MKTFNKLFLAIATLFLIASINAETIIDFSETQKVYLAPKPLPLIAKDLKKKYNMSDRQILKHLKKTLPKITPKLAKETFDIDWIDNSVPEEVRKYFFQETRKKEDPKAIFIKGYPAVAVCYMGPEVKYGLFAMSDIPSLTIISEYTGKKINEKNFKSNAYIADLSEDKNTGKFEKIDALNSGNAARFAQHIVSKNDLIMHEYTMNETKMANANNIALPNSGLHAFEDYDNKKVLLLAIQDIKIFKQIGYEYSTDAGYDYPSSQLKMDPYLFYKNGSIIPKNRYQIKRKGVMFADNHIKQKVKIPQIPITGAFDYLDILGAPYKLETFNDNENYIVITFDIHKRKIIVNNKLFHEKISYASKNHDVGRLTILSYILPINTNVRKFINILKKTIRTKISKKYQTKILAAARKNNFKQANKLFEIAKLNKVLSSILEAPEKADREFWQKLSDMKPTIKDKKDGIDNPNLGSI